MTIVALYSVSFWLLASRRAEYSEATSSGTTKCASGSKPNLEDKHENITQGDGGVVVVMVLNCHDSIVSCCQYPSKTSEQSTPPGLYQLHVVVVAVIVVVDVVVVVVMATNPNEN